MAQLTYQSIFTFNQPLQYRTDYGNLVDTYVAKHVATLYKVRMYLAQCLLISYTGIEGGSNSFMKLARYILLPCVMFS